MRAVSAARRSPSPSVCPTRRPASRGSAGADSPRAMRTRRRTPGRPTGAGCCHRRPPGRAPSRGERLRWRARPLGGRDSCRQRPAGRTRDPADGGHGCAREVVALRVGRDLEPADEPPRIAGADGSQHAVADGVPGDAEAERRDHHHRRHELAVDHRGHGARVALGRPHHLQVVDQVLHAGDERDLDRIAAALRRLEEAEQLELNLHRRLARERRIQRVGLQIVAGGIPVRRRAARGRDRDDHGRQQQPTEAASGRRDGRDRGDRRPRSRRGRRPRAGRAGTRRSPSPSAASGPRRRPPVRGRCRSRRGTRPGR